MRKLAISIITASALLVGAGVASAETTTTTTTKSSWTSDQGAVITQYSTSKHYSSINDPNMNPAVDMVLPSNVTVYPLPETVKVQDPDNYSYTIINNKPVVVERSSRRVVHIW